MLEEISQKPIMDFQFHSKRFWDDFYKNQIRDNNNINWYFDLTKLKSPDFSLQNLSKDDEILIIGSGLSSTLDYLLNNDFVFVKIFDFSEELIKILKEKYKKTEWKIDFIDITAFDASELNNEFNIIIDKGCLDCILFEPKNGENKFIIALNNLLILLDDNGVIYYFSIGKLEDRVKLFDKIPKIKYKITTIDMN